MFQSNKKRDWWAKLSQEQLEKVMKNSRLSKTKKKTKKIQRERYRDRMVEIHKKLVEKMENRARKKQDKERVALIEKERLTEQIRHYGGLLLEKDISVEPAKLKTDPEKRLSLKLQLNLWNKGLETKCDKSLFYMLSGGKIRPVD